MDQLVPATLEEMAGERNTMLVLLEVLAARRKDHKITVTKEQFDAARKRITKEYGDHSMIHFESSMNGVSISFGRGDDLAATTAITPGVTYVEIRAVDTAQ